MWPYVTPDGFLILGSARPNASRAFHLEADMGRVFTSSGGRSFSDRLQTHPIAMRAYKDRDVALSQLGYGSYREYLKSKAWKDIYARVMDKGDGKCVLCDGTATQCHHTFYSKKNLTGKKIAGIVPMCRDCHERIELMPDGKKRASTHTRRMLKRLLVQKKIADHHKKKESQYNQQDI